MRKILISLCCLLSASSTKAQTFTTGNLTAIITDSIIHDSTNCVSNYYAYYNITVNTSYTGETLNMVETSSGNLIGSYVNTAGVSPWTFTTPASSLSGSAGGTGIWDYFIVGGYVYFTPDSVKITCGTDTLHTLPNRDSLFVPNPCAYSTVSGNVYIDNNANCIFDAGDVGLNSPTVNFTENYTPVLSGMWNQGWPNYSYTPGGYTIGAQVSWLANYTVSLPAYYAFIFPTSPCFAGSYTFTTLPQASVDFPLLCTTNIDVQSYALSPVTVRLHTPFYMDPYVSNTGCDTASGQLTMVLDNRVTYDPLLSTYPADTVRGDTLIWNYYALSNTSGGAYWNSFQSSICLSPNSTVAVGDTLCFRVYSNAPAADINPANNDQIICLPVVYSYDPNLKEVSPKGYGTPGNIPAGNDTLTYTLHFQNTGSDFAENISVIDTLDSHINAASLKILGSSHTMIPKWITSHIVEFDYAEINLPDSTSNEPASHGEVRFSVALNAGLPLGTEIRNTGYIYFDENAPVVTNTVLNTIALPNSINQVAIYGQPKIYPNPATDKVFVENLNGSAIFISNLNGSVILQQDITGDKSSIDITQLPVGVYILKTVNGSRTTTTKLTKF